MVKTFFSNTTSSVMYLAIGFFVLIGGSLVAQSNELAFFSGISAVVFFLTALFFNVREYNKDYDKIKRL